MSQAKSEKRLGKWWLRKSMLVALIAIVAIAAWVWVSWYGQRYPTWHEEVQLSDGRVIVVKQKHEYYDNYGTNQSWVTFSLPEMGGERTWHSYLKPMHVDVYGGKVYVFGRPRGDRQVQYYGFPKSYLVAFSWSGTDFVRVPFMSLPPAIRATENIFPCVPSERGATLTWEQKEREWCAPSDGKGLLVREINLQAYESLARDYARRSGGLPVTE